MRFAKSERKNDKPSGWVLDRGSITRYIAFISRYTGVNKMGYENLNSTKMLATNCAVCSRPLRDAVSVEMGIGPECREKYGYNACVSEANRERANQLIFLIADKQDGMDVMSATRQLRELGFEALANKIAIRLFEVRIELDKSTNTYRVTGPYTEASVAAFRSVPGRRWNKDLGTNEIPASSKPQLWAALKKGYPNYNVLGPDGNFFKVPPFQAFA